MAIALTQDAATLLKELCEHDAGLKELLDNTCESHGWDAAEIREGYTTKLQWSSIKWYEGYSDVDKFCTFMQNISDVDYYFIRLGEEADDVTQEGSFWEPDMYIERTIVL